VVEKGLTVGDRVVTNGQYRLRPKSKVAIIASTGKQDVAVEDAPDAAAPTKARP